MVDIVIGIFSVQSKVTVASSSTARITTDMNKNIDQTLELFKKVGVGHVVTLTKFSESIVGFIESVSWVAIGCLGIHALLYQLQ